MFLRYFDSLAFRNLYTTSFDKITKTRHTSSVAMETAGEDEVDECAVRVSTVKISADIVLQPVDLGVSELARDSGANRPTVDSGEVALDFVTKLEADKNTIRQSEDLEIEIEDLSNQVVEKHDDVSISAQESEAKAEEKVYLYTYRQMFWSLLAMGSYIVDIGSDVFVAYTYSVEGHWWFFGITLGFVVVSSLTQNVISFGFYVEDNAMLEWRKIKTSRANWMRRIVLHVLQLGPLVRYADNIWCGLQSRRAVKSMSAVERNCWHKMKADEDGNSTILRLFECYMEAAPQLTLQLYIIMHPDHGFSKTVYFAVGQVVGCVSSGASIAWTLTFFYTMIRDSPPKKSDMTNRATIAMFTWRFCSVSARVLAFALFASYFRFWIIMVVAFHFAVVLVWIQCQQTSLCVSEKFDVFFLVLMALLNIFDYFKSTEGHTRLRCLLYYILIFVENLAMALAIFLVPSPIASPSHLHPVMISILALHLIGIAIQVTYYLRFHPKNDSESGMSGIQLCIPCTALLEECCSPPE